jgi:hypothetical protein
MAKMVTIPEAAEHFQVSVATIRRWIRAQRLASQLTLGPYGEQWMVDIEQAPLSSQRPYASEGLNAGAFVPVQQCTVASSNTTDGLLREAEQALQEAWKAKEEAERELQQARAVAPARSEASVAPADPVAPVSDWTALQRDLEGSERVRARLQSEIERLRKSEEEAWQESRAALRALHHAYADLEAMSGRLRQLETEQECLRKALARRLGVDWREHDLLALFLRWDSESEVHPWATASMERPDWSQYRRVPASQEVDAV